MIYDIFENNDYEFEIEVRVNSTPKDLRTATFLAYAGRPKGIPVMGQVIPINLLLGNIKVKFPNQAFTYSPGRIILTAEVTATIDGNTQTIWSRDFLVKKSPIPA